MAFQLVNIGLGFVFLSNYNLYRAAEINTTNHVDEEKLYISKQESKVKVPVYFVILAMHLK